MEAPATPLRLVDVPSDALHCILLSLGDWLAWPEIAVRSLCSLAATCTRLRDEVARAETLWHDLSEACYPVDDGRSSGPMYPNPDNGPAPAPLGRTELCARLAAWRKYADGIEVPSALQMVQVVSRSANAHSYYKHLNIGRTARFSFHLSHIAGKRCVRDGEAEHYVDYVRGDGTEFHYTWTPTAEYRRAFGMVAYMDGVSMRPGLVLQPRVLELARADATVVLQPAYVDAASHAFCSAVVHGEGEPREGYFEVAYQRLQEEGVEAVKGRMLQVEICDAALQRRQMDCVIEIPRSALGFLAVMAKWEEPLREELAALLARQEWTALVEAVGRDEEAMQRPAMLSDKTKESFVEKKALHLLLASLAAPASTSGSGATPLAEALTTARGAAAELPAILHKLGDGLFGALPGRARAAAVEHVVLQFTVYGSGRRHAAVAAVDLAERIDERVGMFDALSRVVGFVCGSPVESDLSAQVYDDPELYGKLLGMQKRYTWQ